MISNLPEVILVTKDDYLKRVKEVRQAERQAVVEILRRDGLSYAVEALQEEWNLQEETDDTGNR